MLDIFESIVSASVREGPQMLRGLSVPRVRERGARRRWYYYNVRDKCSTQHRVVSLSRVAGRTVRGLIRDNVKSQGTCERPGSPICRANLIMHKPAGGTSIENIFRHSCARGHATVVCSPDVCAFLLGRGANGAWIDPDESVIAATYFPCRRWKNDFATTASVSDGGSGQSRL